LQYSVATIATSSITGDTMEESPFKGKTGLTRFMNAVGYSVSGFASAYRHEEAFRQEVLLAVLLTATAFWLDVTGLQRALMLFCVMLVLIVELLNSAVEAAVDRISFENHRLAKRAKDIGSAAVFVALANVAIVWSVILAG
jgi:diacylglycerol kinase (ATP)